MTQHQHQQMREARRLASQLTAPELTVQLRGVARDTNPLDAAIVLRAVERIEELEAALRTAYNYPQPGGAYQPWMALAEAALEGGANPLDAAIASPAVERVKELEAALKGMLAQFGYCTNTRGNALTDEEVWLRAYCAAMVWEGRTYPETVYANMALGEFRRKFRKVEEEPPASDRQ